MTRLISLTVKNYRPFYEKTTFFFSVNSNKNFNIICAGTGGGKTTFLDSIAWCLYGKEIHKPQPIETMLNDKKRFELKKKESADVEVEIIMGESEKNINYVFFRKVTFYKDENEKVRIIPESGTFKAKVKDARNNLIDYSGPVEYLVDRIFPEEIQHLFMFDGEQLQNFFDEDNSKKTKEAIIDITQINFLDSAIRHLKDIIKVYKPEKEGENPEVGKYVVLINSANRQLDEKRIERKKTEEQLKSAKHVYNTIQEKLGKLGSEEIKKLIQDEGKLQEDLKIREEELSEKEKGEFQHLLNSVPFIFCKKELERSLKIINQKYESGELPPGMRFIFLKKLLEREPCICICGRGLEKGSQERKRVEKYRDKAPLSEYEDDIREGEAEIRKRLENLQSFFDERKRFYEEIKKIKDNITKINESLRLIEKKRKGFNQDEINSLFTQRDFQFGEIERYNQKIGEIDESIKELEGNASRWDGEKRKLEKEEIKSKEMKKRFEVCDQSITFLEKIKEEILIEVKNEIEKKTDYVCKCGLKNENRIDKIIINDDFELQVLKKEKYGGGEMYRELSAGQKEILATSFIMALRKESGFDSPIIFDFPFGRLDPEKRKELIESLKSILNDVQVNFTLIGGTEYTDRESYLMKDRVGEFYEITKIENESRSEVIRHGRSKK